MGKHCEICGMGEQGCDDPTVHLSRKAEGKRIVQEMLVGKWMEEPRVDVEKGREARKREYESVMEAGPERDAARGFLLKYFILLYCPAAGFCGVCAEAGGGEGGEDHGRGVRHLLGGQEQVRVAGGALFEGEQVD
jgi:hypothetical protein